MFLAAGSVLHGAGTKDLERLGGLVRRMRADGQSSMMLGATAIAGLPPLNGFVSEWLIYLGLIRRRRLARRARWASSRCSPWAWSPSSAGWRRSASCASSASRCSASRAATARRTRTSPRSWMLAPMVVLAAAALVIAAWCPRASWALLRLAAMAQLAGPAVAGRRAPGARGVGGASARLATIAVWIALGIGGAARDRTTRRPRPRRRDLGLRLRGADGAHAVHRALVQRDPRRASAAAAAAPARRVSPPDGIFPTRGEPVVRRPMIR